jgi:hypothetical protein
MKKFKLEKTGEFSAKDPSGKVYRVIEFTQFIKVTTLEIGNMVLSGRGHWLFLSSAYCACAGAGGDFDSMVDKLPELLQQGSWQPRQF